MNFQDVPFQNYHKLSNGSKGKLEVTFFFFGNCTPESHLLAFSKNRISDTCGWKGKKILGKTNKEISWELII